MCFLSFYFGWISGFDYLNEVMHVIANKNIDTLYDEIKELVEEGME